MWGMASDALVSDQRRLTAGASVMNRMQTPEVSLLRSQAVDETLLLAESGSRSKGPAVLAHPLPSISNDAASRHRTSSDDARPGCTANTTRRTSALRQDIIISLEIITMGIFEKGIGRLLNFFSPASGGGKPSCGGDWTTEHQVQYSLAFK